MFDLTLLLFTAAALALLVLVAALVAENRRLRVLRDQGTATPHPEPVTDHIPVVNPADPEDLEAILAAVRDTDTQALPVFDPKDWTTGVFAQPAPSRSIPHRSGPRVVPRTPPRTPPTTPGSRYGRPIDDVTTTISAIDRLVGTHDATAPTTGAPSGGAE